MPNINDLFPTKSPHWQELKGTEPLLTIDRIEMEQMMGGGTEPVLYFYGKKKGVVLNKTNATEIAAKHGETMEDWTGKEIELFSMMVPFQGQNVPAIRVRAVNPEPVIAETVLTGPADPNDPIGI